MITPLTKLVVDGDVDEDFISSAVGSTVACDIETTGLDYSRDKIATIQLSSGNAVRIVRLGSETPSRVLQLLEDDSTLKVFHHAPFDLTFMYQRWGVVGRRIACTKVAARLAEPGLPDGSYSLKPLLARHLGVHISKSEQVSNWLRTELTTQQVTYASNDVIYLEPLLQKLSQTLEIQGRLQLAQRFFDFLPTVAQGRALGAEHLFEH
jgi:ribonuclease D